MGHRPAPGNSPGSEPPSELSAGSTASSSIPNSCSRPISPYSCAWSRTSPVSTVRLGPCSRVIPSNADSKRSLSLPRRTMRYLLAATVSPGSGRRRGARCWAWAMAQAALTRPMWLNACGKLPIISPSASISSASRPTSLMADTARSNVATAWSTSPASACAWASQKVHSRKVPSSPASPSCAR